LKPVSCKGLPETEVTTRPAEPQELSGAARMVDMGTDVVERIQYYRFSSVALMVPILAPLVFTSER